MSRTSIFTEIEAERAYQDSKWGIEFDDKNTINDWVTYLNIYAAAATKIGQSKAAQRAQLLKVATLAVATLETFDRNDGFAPRHYDTVAP